MERQVRKGNNEGSKDVKNQGFHNALGWVIFFIYGHTQCSGLHSSSPRKTGNKDGA